MKDNHLEPVNEFDPLTTSTDAAHLFGNNHNQQQDHNNNNNLARNNNNNHNSNRTNHERRNTSNNVNERFYADDRRQDASETTTTSNERKQSPPAATFVRQLGRRVSFIPQLLAQQVTSWHSGVASRRQSSHDANLESNSFSCCDARRYSLPTSALNGAHRESRHHHHRRHEDLEANLQELSPTTTTTTTTTTTALMMCQSGSSSSSGSSAVGQDLDQLGACHNLGEVPATVAGVGGTITTVTRSKRKTAPLPRLVAKNGQVNLFLDNIDRRQYMRDLFTTMIDIKWRYNLMAAAFGFVFSWLLFACIWYLVLYVHQDLEHENDPAWSPCIVNVYSFPAALLFSIETQSTLGFGSRIISVECPGAILIFCAQLIFGVVVECLIVGMVFAKLSRPTKRSQTIMYSKYATVCLREAKMCLTFRVGDVRSKSHIIGATLRASLVSSKTTQEGESIPFYYYKLKVIIDDCKDSLLLIWPVTIVHVIDESSPFYKLNSDELANFKFEIITVLEGTVESTGQSIQVRSSYLPSEVKWGYRFEPIVSTHGYGKYAQTIIDYNKFNRILEVPTPKCSPMDYYADQKQQQQQQVEVVEPGPVESCIDQGEKLSSHERESLKSCEMQALQQQQQQVVEIDC